MRRDRDGRQRLNQLRPNSTPIVHADRLFPPSFLRSTLRSNTLSASSTHWNTVRFSFLSVHPSSLLVHLLWQLSRLRHPASPDTRHSTFLRLQQNDNRRRPTATVFIPYIPLPTLDIHWSSSLLASFFALFYSLRILLFITLLLLGSPMYLCVAFRRTNPSNQKSPVCRLIAPHCITYPRSPCNTVPLACILLSWLQWLEESYAFHCSCDADCQCGATPSTWKLMTVGSVASVAFARRLCKAGECPYVASGSFLG